MDQATTRLKHASGLIHEFPKIWVAVRSLDIHHHVKGPIRKRQGHRIALDKPEVGHLVAGLAVADALGVEIERNVFRWPEGTRQEGRPAPVTTTHLEHAGPSQPSRCRDVMVELNIRAERFIGGRQGNPHRRLRLEGVVQKVDTLGTDAAGEERIPPTP